MTNEFSKPDNEGTPSYYGGKESSNSQSPYGQPASSNGEYQEAQPSLNQPYQPQASTYELAGVAATSNKNALVSLIVSLATLFLLCGIPILGIITALVGVVFGHKFLKETANVPNSGQGMALAGTICGYFALVASVIVSGIFLFLLLATDPSTVTY